MRGGEGRAYLQCCRTSVEAGAPPPLLHHTLGKREVVQEPVHRCLHLPRLDILQRNHHLRCILVRRLGELVEAVQQRVRALNQFLCLAKISTRDGEGEQSARVCGIGSERQGWCRVAVRT